MDATTAAVSKRLPGLKKKSSSRSGLRNLVQGCWSYRSPVEKKPDPQPNLPQFSISALPDDVLLDCLARMPRAALQTAMMVCQKWRSILKSTEFYEMRKQNGRVENLLFVFGGAGTGFLSAVYCKSSGSWRAGLLCSGRSIAENDWLSGYHNENHALLHAQPAVIKHRIFILGANPCRFSKSVGIECTIVYDAWTKTLRRGAPMHCPRKKFACCVIADRIFVAGGANRNDSGRDAITDSEMYIPELDAWKPIASMPRKRYGGLGAAVNGVFYVIGGLKFSSTLWSSMQPYIYVASMDAFDTNLNCWQKTKVLPMDGCVIACTVVGRAIYMLTSHAVELSFWKYDTWDESFTRVKPPPIPSPLRIDNCLKFSCVTMGSDVYIIQVGGSIDDLLRRSGRNGRGYKEGLVLIYDTCTLEWSRGPDLPYVKNGATCTVVQC
ncbi:F-box/kelch-repeat protein At5g26960 [Physcomitrium patens]|uniref:F-box domain-containing protein n=1 Tax=Physcomitrium patens TaxID=3218 RepID=A9U5W3_PHYPA|nr:F-box/kelch-repeat protein At5g26960-like [Physcomitrium patens]PNR54797.1 hypothetical protein PHYPA_005690 [Physcomitrium patens]|eukprot:XP_024374279.1 F-box/kelch-repeat protein At5g26960-like [Physcomitrella patens]